jgi:hypothetical protein
MRLLHIPRCLIPVHTAFEPTVLAPLRKKTLSHAASDAQQTSTNHVPYDYNQPA